MAAMKENGFALVLSLLEIPQIVCGPLFLCLCVVHTQLCSEHKFTWESKLVHYLIQTSSMNTVVCFSRIHKYLPHVWRMLQLFSIIFSINDNWFIVHFPLRNPY